MQPFSACIVDGHHGRYLPQVWADRYGEQAILLANVDAESVEDLTHGPDYWQWIDAEYDEAWTSILDSYCHSVWTKDGFDRYYLMLGESGDLYEVNETWLDENRDEMF